MSDPFLRVPVLLHCSYLVLQNNSFRWNIIIIIIIKLRNRRGLRHDWQYQIGTGTDIAIDTDPRTQNKKRDFFADNIL
jgi:hypothetical protein